MSTVTPQPQPTPTPQAPQSDDVREVIVYSHSSLFYWWPVWVVGFIMAFITAFDGVKVAIPPGGPDEYMIHPNKLLGVIYTLVFFLTIIMTNVTFRGLTSAIVILVLIVAVLAMAYFGVWEPVLYWVGRLDIYMNLGFYVFFSSLMFAVWFFATFIYDRMHYWRVRPGQLTYEYVFGGGQKSYDTRGMVLEKLREDLFRHWILGLGSGDLHIITTGATREEMYVPNVLFVDAKVRRIQNLIKLSPERPSEG
jgi:hypothetical protein